MTKDKYPFDMEALTRKTQIVKGNWTYTLLRGETKVVDGYDIKTGCVRSTSYKLEDLLEDGAIKRPEPKEETNMIYTQEMVDNGEWPAVGMEVVARYNFDSKQVIHQGEVLYVSKHHVILNTIHGNEWHGLLDDFTMEPLPPVKTELEIAQEKQVIDVANALREDDEISYTATAKLLQEKGMLAEIILPVDLVNGCFYEFDYLSVTMSGHFCSAFREFYVASEHKSFPYISCTNIIKLLTVEG